MNEAEQFSSNSNIKFKFIRTNKIAIIYLSYKALLAFINMNVLINKAKKRVFMSSMHVFLKIFTLKKSVFFEIQSFYIFFYCNLNDKVNCFFVVVECAYFITVLQ